MPASQLNLKDVEERIDELTDDIFLTECEITISGGDSPQDEEALMMLETKLHQANVDKKTLITKANIDSLQSFFDKYDIQFDVELFIYLLQQTVRSIGLSQRSYDFTHYLFDEIEIEIEDYKKQRQRYKLPRIQDAVGRLALTFYYLDSVLGPLVHSFPVLSRLFQLTKADTLTPEEDVDAMRALMCVLCYNQKKLKSFIFKHTSYCDLQPTLDMLKDYIGRRTEMAKKLNQHDILKHYHQQRAPLSKQLKTLYQLSDYAYDERHVKPPLFFSPSAKDKKALQMRTLKKLADYWCGRRMILKEDEFLTIVEKGSSLRELISQFILSYPTPSPIIARFKIVYDSFPVPDDDEQPHNIDFFPHT